MKGEIHMFDIKTAPLTKQQLADRRKHLSDQLMRLARYDKQLTYLFYGLGLLELCVVILLYQLGLITSLVAAVAAEIVGAGVGVVAAAIMIALAPIAGYTVATAIVFVGPVAIAFVTADVLAPAVGFAAASAIMMMTAFTLELASEVTDRRPYGNAVAVAALMGALTTVFAIVLAAPVALVVAIAGVFVPSVEAAVAAAFAFAVAAAFAVTVAVNWVDTGQKVANAELDSLLEIESSKFPDECTRFVKWCKTDSTLAEYQHCLHQLGRNPVRGEYTAAESWIREIRSADEYR